MSGTTSLGLTKKAVGETGWLDATNDNMDLIDGLLTGDNILGSINAAGVSIAGTPVGTSSDTYWSTDGDAGIIFAAATLIGTTQRVITEAQLIAAVANAAVKNIIVDAAFALSANRAVTKPLYVMPGAEITCTGFTLTLSKPLLSTGSYQQFVAAAGEVVFTSAQNAYYNPAWFGFSTGATGTNNQIYLTAFISAVPAYALIRILEGTYAITGLVTFTKAATILATGTTFNFAVNDANQGIRITASDVTWKGGTITGPQHAASVSTQIGIYAYGADVDHYISNIRISDVTVSNFGYTDILLGFVQEFTITKTEVYDAYYAGIMTLSCDDGDITKNTVRDIIADGVAGTNAYGISCTKSSGTEAAHPTSSHIRVTDNYLDGMLTWEALDTHGGYDISFVNNTIVECRTGIGIMPYTSTAGDEMGPRYCRAIHNLMYTNHGAGEQIARADMSFGISLAGYSAGIPATSCLIEDNTINGFGDLAAGGGDCSINWQYTSLCEQRKNQILQSGVYATKLTTTNSNFLIDGDHIAGAFAGAGAAWLGVYGTGNSGVVQNCYGELGADHIVIADTGDHTDVHLKNNRMVTSEATPYTNLAYLGNVDPVAKAKITWNPASIAGGGVETKDITLPGTFAGHFVDIRTSMQLGSLILSGQSDANKVTLYLRNPTAGALDLVEGTFYVRTIQY